MMDALVLAVMLPVTELLAEDLVLLPLADGVGDADVHAPDPTPLDVPVGQTACCGEVDPGGQ